MMYVTHVIDVLTILVTLAPLLAWLLRLFATQSLVLTARRSGRVFRFSLHNLVAAPFAGEVELRIEIDDAGGTFAPGGPVLLCGPRSVDIQEEFPTAQNPGVYSVKAKRLRPLATWTVVVQGSAETTRMKATLVKPKGPTAVASEEGTKEVRSPSALHDPKWIAVPLLAYVLVTYLTWSRLAPVDVQYSAPWFLLDVVISLVMMAFIGFGYGLCVRSKRPAALLPGYVGLDGQLPRDSGQSAP